MILVSNKIDFQTNLIKRDRGGHFILIKGKFHQEDTANLKIVVPNMREPTFVYETSRPYSYQLAGNSDKTKQK